MAYENGELFLEYLMRAKERDRMDSIEQIKINPGNIRTFSEIEKNIIRIYGEKIADALDYLSRNCRFYGKNNTLEEKDLEEMAEIIESNGRKVLHE
ncbi:MAG: hypothetical protein WDZ77_01920 [Candidatus Pacearchaeota archaeon]